jgi:hypothetical protein
LEEFEETIELLPELVQMILSDFRNGVPEEEILQDLLRRFRRKKMDSISVKFGMLLATFWISKWISENEKIMRFVV